MDINENGNCICLECWVELPSELMNDRWWYEICDDCLSVRWEWENED